MNNKVSDLTIPSDRQYNSQNEQRSFKSEQFSLLIPDSNFQDKFWSKLKIWPEVPLTKTGFCGLFRSIWSKIDFLGQVFGKIENLARGSPYKNRFLWVICVISRVL